MTEINWYETITDAQWCYFPLSEDGPDGGAFDCAWGPLPPYRRMRMYDVVERVLSEGLKPPSSLMIPTHSVLLRTRRARQHGELD